MSFSLKLYCNLYNNVYITLTKKTGHHVFHFVVMSNCFIWPWAVLPHLHALFVDNSECECNKTSDFSSVFLLKWISSSDSFLPWENVIRVNHWVQLGHFTQLLKRQWWLFMCDYHACNACDAQLLPTNKQTSKQTKQCPFIGRVKCFLSYSHTGT